MKKFFQSWSWFELAWLTVFSVVAIFLSLRWGDTLFSFSVFLTGVLCVVLVAKGSIWNYAWFSWQNGFFGEVMLNAGFFLPMQLVGFLMWKRHMNGKEVEMKRQNFILRQIMLN